jgi:hypothetical protein
VARSRLAGARLDADEAAYLDIEQWYRDRLANTRPPVDLAWTPVYVGPTWRYENGAWVLPDHTLGWRVLAWCGRWLKDKRGEDWQFTPEQARFILWFYSLDEDGHWLYDQAVLQRLKGWGKDPLAACMAAAACFAPVTFDHWHNGRPIGREEPAAWVQVVAVSQEQTKNTMKLFPSLLSSAETRSKYGIQVGKLHVWGMGDTRQIESVTSSPMAIEGGRPTLVIRNEIQNWNTSNGGHDMNGAIEGNVAKSEGAAARILDICNAYRPGEDSVGERAREAWEETQDPDGDTLDYGVMYDSLEAPPEAPLSAEAAPGVVESIRGDATWLNTKRIVNSILNTTNTASESRRKWYNQIVAAEDARFDPLKVALCRVEDQLQPGDEIVLFGDGSKSDDASGLVACRMRDGLVQLLHVQQPKKKQIVNRALFTLAVRKAFSDYKVIAFWFDPGHIIDENADGDERFWWPTCDEWALEYGRQLKYWPVQSGPNRHSIIFDMSSSTHTAQFTGGVEVMAEDIENGTFRFRRSTNLEQHIKNARNAPNKYGISMMKNNRESRKKIDLAVCAAGARMLWRHIQMARLADKRKGAPGKGRVIVLA